MKQLSASIAAEIESLAATFFLLCRVLILRGQDLTFPCQSQVHLRVKRLQTICLPIESVIFLLPASSTRASLLLMLDNFWNKTKVKQLQTGRCHLLCVNVLNTSSTPLPVLALVHLCSTFCSAAYASPASRGTV